MIHAPRLTGRRIRELRTKLGLSQAELAAHLHTSPLTILRWENDHIRPEGPGASLLAAMDARLREREQRESAEKLKQVLGAAAATLVLATLLEALFGKSR